MEKLNTYFKENILFKNSLYLIFSNGILSLGGFVFWIFVARIYTTYEIGITTTLIAIVSLISSLALLGFNTGIMRFLPTSENKNVLINSILSLVTLSSLIVGVVVLLNLDIFSPPLRFVSLNPLLFAFFIIFTIFASLNMLLEAILIALRSAKFVLIKNIVQAIIKLLLPFWLIGLGSFGIFSSYYGGGIIALILGGILLHRAHNVIYKIRINSLEVKKIVILSFGTYISGLMSTVTLYVLPILITNILGPKQTAFYYIVVTTTNVLNFIPLVIAQNLMVEGSYNIAHLETHLKKAMQLIVVILVPFILLIFLFGNYILLVFGKQYSAEGLTLLRLLSICSLLVGLNYILSTLILIFNQVKLLVITNTLYALCLYGTSYYFIHFGIVGIGYATILSQLLLLSLYSLSLIKIKKLFLFKSIWNRFTHICA